MSFLISFCFFFAYQLGTIELKIISKENGGANSRTVESINVVIRNQFEFKWFVLIEQTIYLCVSQKNTIDRTHTIHMFIYRYLLFCLHLFICCHFFVLFICVRSHLWTRLFQDRKTLLAWTLFMNHHHCLVASIRFT